MATTPQNVVVIGVGGIGTWFTHGVARALHAQAPGSVLILIDGDTFEPKNTARQAFTMPGPKAQIVRAEVQPLVPSVAMIAQTAWIVSEEVAANYEDDGDGSIGRITAESVLTEGCHVFCMVDNFAARKLVFDAAKKYQNIDIYTGGNGSPDTGDGLFGTVYHYCRRDGVDVTATPGEYHPEFVTPADRNPGEMSCQERAELEGGEQLLSINMAVASMLLAQFFLNLFGTDEEKAEALTKSEIVLDLREGLAANYDRRPAPQLATASASS